VRHVRMLGLSLIALFAVGAMAAGPALAIKNPSKSFKVFENCPVKAFGANGVPVTLCNFGATEIGEKGTSAGGHFTVGGITVPIEKQIILQFGGASLNGLNEYEAVQPTHGFEFITPTPENVPGEPFGHITPAEQEELGWPETLKRSYSEAQKHGLVKKATEAIETAGPPRVELARLIFEEETGVEVKVKIKAGNAWLSAVGDVCYVGSEAEPIVQELTTGAIESPLTHETLHGSAGEIKGVERKGQEMDILFHNVLVDNTYAVPGANCTGPYSGVIAATINKKFGLPAAAGASVTEIKGTLYAASSEAAERVGGA
jgi:hypothetical protein